MKTAVLETSIDAYHAHQAAGLSQQKRHKILSAIKAMGGDWTICELAHVLGIEKSTVSGRINELLHSGCVEAATKRKDRVSGVMARPVALPSGQDEAH